ncbi:hypothetical protein ACWCY6_02420 [Streptomyces sp. 900105755]
MPGTLLLVRLGVAEGGDAVVLDPERWLELRRFRALVESGAVTLTEVARETGLDRKTVRKYLSSTAPSAPPRRRSNGRPRRKAVDEVAPLIDAMVRAEILIKGAVVHERVVNEYGSTINYQRVKRICRKPGRRSQVNWASSHGSCRACTAASRWFPELRPRSTGVTRAGSSRTSASRRSTPSQECFVDVVTDLPADAQAAEPMQMGLSP